MPTENLPTPYNDDDADENELEQIHQFELDSKALSAKIALGSVVIITLTLGTLGILAADYYSQTHLHNYVPPAWFTDAFKLLVQSSLFALGFVAIKQHRKSK